jgi:beta propeller repeat protein
MKIFKISIVFLACFFLISTCFAQDFNVTENFYNSPGTYNNSTRTNFTLDESQGNPFHNPSVNFASTNSINNGNHFAEVPKSDGKNESIDSNKTSQFSSNLLENYTPPEANDTPGSKSDKTPNSSQDSSIIQSEPVNASFNNTVISNPFVIIRIPGTETSLTPNAPGIEHAFPGIHDDFVYWIEYSDSISIHIYDLITGIEIKIPIEGYSLYWYPTLDFSDGRLVYTGDYEGNYSVFIYTLSTANQSRIVVGPPGSSQINPSIDGERIVYEDNRNGNNAIFLFDILSGEEIPVSDAPDSIQHLPVIAGDYVSWVSEKDGKYSIYLYSISTKTSTCIVNDTGEFNPVRSSIFSGHIAWEGFYNQKFSIFIYNITNRQNQDLTDEMGLSDQKNPKISNDFITFENWKDQLSSIYLFNISTGEKFSVSIDPSSTLKTNPSISGNRIVWQDNPNGNSEVFMYTIGETRGPVIADYSANQTVGQIPFSIQFTDLSSGNPSSYTWDFGDGNYSTEKSPVHTYTNTGLYTVRLTVSTPWSRDSKYLPDYITAGTVPRSGFTATPSSGPSELEVMFTDISTGSPDTWKWEFGDSGYSDVQNPVHVFNSPGTFSVRLTAGNQFGNSSSNTTIQVFNATTKVTSLSNPAVLSYSPDTGFIELNMSATGFSIVLTNNDSSVIVTPFYRGQPKMIFSTVNGEVFQVNNGTINGNLTVLQIETNDFFLQTPDSNNGFNASGNFSFNLAGYHPDSEITTKITREYSSDEYQNLLTTLNRGTYFSANSINSIAFILHTVKNNLEVPGPAVINMSVCHNWVVSNSQFVEPTERFVLETTDSNNSFIPLDTRFLYENSTEMRDYFIVRNPSGIDLSKIWVPVFNSSLNPEGAKIELVSPVVTNSMPDSVTISIDSNWVMWNKPYQWNSVYEPVVILRIDDNGVGEVLNTSYLGYDPLNGVDVFQAYSPYGLSEFALTTVSNPGNPLQMLYLSVSTRVTPPSPTSNSNTGGGGGGGGSYGGSGNQISPSSMSESIKGSQPASAQEATSGASLTNNGESASKSQESVSSSSPSTNPVPQVSKAPVANPPVLPPQPTNSIFSMIIEAAAIVSIFVLVVFSVYMRSRRQD